MGLCEHMTCMQKYRGYVNNLMGVFKSSRIGFIPRPPLWRLCLIQCLVWGLVLLVCGLIWPQLAPSIFWAGLVAIPAQAYWVWCSLRTFGDPHSDSYLAGTTAGLVGKWVIISVGLVLLWRTQPELSVAATVTTVFGLNTLAALVAPIFISNPR